MLIIYISLAYPQACLMTSLMLSTAAYGLGVGAVPAVMVGEVFTPELRTLGACITSVTRSDLPT